jgi:hypothetical protein
VYCQFHGRVYVDSASYYDLHAEDKPDIYNADGRSVSDYLSSDYDDDYTRSSIYDSDDMGKNLPYCGCEKCHGLRPHPAEDFPWALYDIIDPVKETRLDLQEFDKISRHRYLLCDRKLIGFDLKSRNWSMSLLNGACCT